MAQSINHGLTWTYDDVEPRMLDALGVVWAEQQRALKDTPKRKGKPQPTPGYTAGEAF